jgi:hypothetical protein
MVVTVMCCVDWFAFSVMMSFQVRDVLRDILSLRANAGVVRWVKWEVEVLWD